MGKVGAHRGCPCPPPWVSPSRPPPPPPSVIDTRPDLWAEAGSLQEPWANLTLVCRAYLGTSNFQLFKDGELLERVRFSEGGLEHRFPLGAVTGDTQGLYRCRYAMGENRWTSLSNLLEVTGAGESGPPPSLPAPPPSAWGALGQTLTFLSLSFPVCKMRVIFVLTPRGFVRNP